MANPVLVESSAPAFGEQLAQGGVSRRRFLQFCGLMAATLALPARYGGRIAQALEMAVRPPVVWLNFQDCTGDTESFLRANQPDVDDLLLDILSLNYHETIMVPSGAMSTKSLSDTVRDYAGQYICVVEGSIPTRDGGVYCGIGGRTALSIAQEVCSQALATLAVGTCAWEGGLPAAAPNPTGAVGVKDAVPGLATLINLPGCPVNVANLAATIVHFLTFNQWPETGDFGRPLFAYGEELHENCPRHEHYEHEEFVLEWGDERHRQGWCLFRMGCRGPDTHHNCPSVKWNDGTDWPIGAGHGCLGCSEQRFWDRHSPFYVPGED